MAKASEKIASLTVRGEGGAVWEVDDTDAIRGLIEAGHLTVVMTRQARKIGALDAGEQGSLAPQEG
jgi:hypothetical protein